MSAQPNQPYDDKPERHRPFSTLLSNLTPGGDDSDREITAVYGGIPRPTFTARGDEPATPDPVQPVTASDLHPVAGTVPDGAVPDGTVRASTVPEPVGGPVNEADPVNDEPLGGDVAPASVPPAPRANSEALLPGFRRGSIDGDGAKTFHRHAAPPVTGEPVGGTAPVAPVPSAMPSRSASIVDEPLLADAADFRVRWQQTQAGFVDDPRAAVGEAADLIEQTAQALVVAVRQRQRRLRESWDAAPDAQHDSEQARVPDTEQLRLMMQRYRALFNQLCRP